MTDRERARALLTRAADAEASRQQAMCGIATGRAWRGLPSVAARAVGRELVLALVQAAEGAEVDHARA